MNSALSINPEELKIIQEILQNNLKQKANVWVFGSRANNTAQKYSDLDLLIDNMGQPISLNLLANLTEAFDESNLPYKVDIVDYNSISDEFKENIRESLVTFPGF